MPNKYLLQSSRAWWSY